MSDVTVAHAWSKSSSAAYPVFLLTSRTQPWRSSATLTINLPRSPPRPCDPELVLTELDPGQFLQIMVTMVLENSTVAHHVEARNPGVTPAVEATDLKLAPAVPLNEQARPVDSGLLVRNARAAPGARTSVLPSGRR